MTCIFPMRNWGLREGGPRGGRDCRRPRARVLLGNHREAGLIPGDSWSALLKMFILERNLHFESQLHSQYPYKVIKLLRKRKHIYVLYSLTHEAVWFYQHRLLD